FDRHSFKRRPDDDLFVFSQNHHGGGDCFSISIRNRNGDSFWIELSNGRVRRSKVDPHCLPRFNLHWLCPLGELLVNRCGWVLASSLFVKQLPPADGSS